MTNTKRTISIIILVFLLFIAGMILYREVSKEETLPPFDAPSSSPTDSPSPQAPKTETIAENLTVVWDMTFLPDGDLLFTERSGRIKRLFLTSDLHVQTVLTIGDVIQQGEGGLHGITLHPEFENNGYVYVYYTYSANGGNTLNRVVRYTYQNNTFSNETVIVDQIPGALFHDGGRIRFGPDNFLYITTGDAQVPSRAQQTDSLAGKILRVTDTGEPAPENPFGNRTYSYGHRNPQGIAWDENGNLWATEHGPSGVDSSCCRDEVNLIKPGNNYGWPTITGDQSQPGMITPVLQSGTETTWAPAGMTFVNGSLFFGGLRGESLYEIILNGTDVVEMIPHFENQFGRIRAVVRGPDGLLYISTSNRDGRGNPRTGDDKIIRINPQRL